MAWSIEFSTTAGKQFDKLDHPVQKRIQGFIARLEHADNPRALGAALTGPYAGKWKYRIGDYRMICEFVDQRLLIYVLELDHRSKIYDWP